ncbi:MAG: hypothetical protein JWR48_4801 [Mycobacterium sp.]|jgi:hypothetical protein|nr:hypothetical protein [Mycobacterium sp.]
MSLEADCQVRPSSRILDFRSARAGTTCSVTPGWSRDPYRVLPASTDVQGCRPIKTGRLRRHRLRKGRLRRPDTSRVIAARTAAKSACSPIGRALPPLTGCRWCQVMGRAWGIVAGGGGSGVRCRPSPLVVELITPTAVSALILLRICRPRPRCQSHRQATPDIGLFAVNRHDLVSALEVLSEAWGPVGGHVLVGLDGA